MANNPAFQLEHELASAMKGIHFPAKREDLIRRARANNAPEEIVKWLEALPDRLYRNAPEVMEVAN